MSTQSDRRSLTEFSDLAEFTAAEGTELGPTDWLLVDQARIDQFAQATDDHQWIHVDPEWAANGPYGSTIAHGLLTLSLLPHFMHHLYRVDNVAMAIEVEGSDKPAAAVESVVRYVA
jgi:acyl dehydratase